MGPILITRLFVLWRRKNMLAKSSSLLPLDPRVTAAITVSPYNRGPGFGAGPFRPGFRGACGCGPIGGCSCASGLGKFRGHGGYSVMMRSGFRGGHGGSNHSGMGKAMGITQFRGLNQGTSLDSIIQSAANWLGGFAQSQLPTSAAVPPQYGSTGAAATQLMGWVPYIIGGIILYKLIK